MDQLKCTEERFEELLESIDRKLNEGIVRPPENIDLSQFFHDFSKFH